MEEFELDVKPKKIRCPECLNYMIVKSYNNGYSGQCPVCKSVICSRVHNPREKIIKIIKQ